MQGSLTLPFGTCQASFCRRIADRIPKIHFAKLTDKDLGGWKRKCKYDMRSGVVCYSYIYPPAYRSHCPAQLRLTKDRDPMSVVLYIKNFHDAEVQSNDHANIAKGRMWQQKESTAQAFLVGQEPFHYFSIYLQKATSGKMGVSISFFTGAMCRYMKDICGEQVSS